MRRTVLAVTSTVVGLVLLLSFKTHAATSSAAAPAASAPRNTPAASGAPAASPGATAAPVSKVVTGRAVDTRYGPVQVQIHVTNGVITAAQAVVYPQNTGRDIEINADAIPALNEEAARADSADIDMISGATYTSQGYVASLQSALDQLK